MSIKVMTAVWEESKEKGAGLLLLLAIADYADDNGLAWPGIDTLARKIRMTPRHTRRLVLALIGVGELDVYERTGRPNAYIVKMGTTPKQQAAALDKAIRMGADARDTVAPAGDDKMSGVTPEPEGDDNLSGGDNLSGVTPEPEGVTPEPEGGDIAGSPDPSLNIMDPCMMDGSIHEQEQDPVDALLERGWNAGDVTAARFVETHGSVYILAMCAHAKGHKLGAGWIRKNAGAWQPSRSKPTNGDSKADRMRFISGEHAALIQH